MASQNVGGLTREYVLMPPDVKIYAKSYARTERFMSFAKSKNDVNEAIFSILAAFDHAQQHSQR